jgi:hypothetical protein
MPTTTVATLQTAWDCKWSRPGFRLTGVSDRLQPETTWVCVRTGPRRDLADDQCEKCAFWEEDVRDTD